MLGRMKTTRRIWRLPRAGSLDRLEPLEEQLPDPAGDEVRVRVEAIGLNFADIFAGQGLYSATPDGPFIPGLECAGVIESMGESAARRGDYAVGDRVVALTRFGAYVTALNVGIEYLRPVPAGWSSAEGAAWLVQGLTAWYGLVELGDVRSGDVVMVQSAAGGVGLLALGMLATLGATPLAVVGTDAKRKFLIEQRGLPAGNIIVRDRRRFGSQLDAALATLGANGVDCVLDAVMGPSFRPAFDRVAPEGRYVVFGAADFMSPRSRPDYLRLALAYLRRPTVDPLSMIPVNRSLMAFNLIWLWNRAERLPEACSELLRLHPGPPHVGSVLPFERAPEALRQLQSGGTIGKVVLTV